MKARLVVLTILTALLAAGGARVANTAESPVATASAYGISVVVPGGDGASAASVSAPAQSAASDAFVFPADGSIARTSTLSSSASADTSGGPKAQAVTDAHSGSLFNGEITWESAAGRARSDASSTDTAGSAVTGLVVLGQAIEATPNGRFPIGDWGSLATLEQAVEVNAGADSTDSRASVTALRVTLTSEHAGLPAGTMILVGHSEAATSIPVPKPKATPRAPAPTPKTLVPRRGPATPSSTPRVKEPGLPTPPEPELSVPGLRNPLIRPLPRDISVSLSPSGYVFPVFGQASFIDTYGAPRAAVTWHHGQDIFAPLGAPILAVADGTVFSVGWNDIGGYRFWLRDREGNQFYYAHLSAFSPLAVNGNEVRAGQVIGFMGNTGDAQGTPYHLHFEFHPVALLPMGYDGVINPYQYLIAWRRLQDIALATASGWAPPVPASARAQAPRPGAFLLGASDISSASGLEPASLQRAFAAPASAEGDGALLRSG